MRSPRSHRLLIGLIVIATVVLTTATHTSASEAMKRRVDRLVQPYLDAKVVVGDEGRKAVRLSDSAESGKKYRRAGAGKDRRGRGRLDSGERVHSAG